ncbi:MAG TPA: histidine kinase [Kribbella sp.]
MTNPTIATVITDRAATVYPDFAEVLGPDTDMFGKFGPADAVLLVSPGAIARDLHDHVNQRLFAAGMTLQVIVARISGSEALARVTRVVSQLDETMREIRTSIFDLYATAEDTLASLRRKMLDLVAEVSANTEVSPAVRIASTVDALVSSRTAEYALAALHEGVSNAVWHARASDIVITAEAGEYLVIGVTDNGVGMPVDVARSGLINLERRAPECGGTITVSDNPGGGTLPRVARAAAERLEQRAVSR